MVTTQRKLGALAFGVFYGGSLVNGFDKGLAYVSRITGKQELSFDQSPWLGLAVFWVSVALMGLLGGYVGRSRISGVAASGVGAALLVAVPPLVSVGFEVRFSIECALAASAFAAGILLTLQGVRLPAPQRDLDFGRVMGVSWKHWLWLWLPWQYFVANLVWLGTPGFILAGNKPSVTTWTSGVVTSVIGVGAVGCTGLRAV
jgi:hypothetical protein